MLKVMIIFSHNRNPWVPLFLENLMDFIRISDINQYISIHTIKLSWEPFWKWVGIWKQVHTYVSRQKGIFFVFLIFRVYFLGKVENFDKIVTLCTGLRQPQSLGICKWGILNRSISNDIHAIFLSIRGKTLHQFKVKVEILLGLMKVSNTGWARAHFIVTIVVEFVTDSKEIQKAFA